MSRWYRTILIAVAVLVLLVPAIVAVAGNINEIFGLDLTLAERAALVVGSTVVIGSFLLYIAWHAKEGPAIGATLQGTALWLPWAAALASSALYLGSVSGPLATDNIDEWAAWAGDRAAQALLVGSGLAGALWLLYAIVDRDFPKARRQSPGWYGLLKSSINGQRLRLTETSSACVDPNVATIRQLVGERLDALVKDLDEPDLKWVTRAGFNVAWSEYHAIDEALIGVGSKASVIDVAMSDLLRLDGSDMPGHAALQHDLQTALTELDPGIEPYITPLVPKDPNAPTPATAAAKPADVVAAPKSGAKDAKPDTSDCETERRSRTVIQTVHRSLNTYRGSRWAELGAARWQLMLTTTVAGIVATLVLALALIRGVHPDQLMTGWAFFLVGAAAGLFLRLRLAADETQVTDDYGLEAARVFQTPLLSGMAAIIGVVLLASLAGSSLGDILTPASEPVAVAVEESPSPEAASTESESPSGEPAASPEATATATAAPASASVQETNSTLSNAFSLGSYPLGLVIALAFGLTPNLVLQRLGVSASNAKKELLATRPM